MEFLGQPAAEGGCSAVRVESASVCARTPHITSDTVDEAKRDYDDILSGLRGPSLRRAVLGWSLPVDLWRMLAWTWRLRRGVRLPHCIGHRGLPSAPSFGRMLFRLLVLVRALEVVPSCWNVAQSVFLPKPGGVSTCRDLRVIALLDPLGKLFFKSLWLRGTGRQLADRPWASGYAVGRCREHAILQHRAFAHRLRAARRPHASIYFDMRNAFWSFKHERICEQIVARCRRQDVTLLQDRVRTFRLWVTGDEDAAEPGALLLLRSGVPPADSWASELFASIYNEAVDKFMEDTAESDFSASMP